MCIFLLYFKKFVNEKNKFYFMKNLVIYINNRYNIFMKYKIIVLGCQMNKNDAERIRYYLNSLGGVEVEEDKDANLFVLVACSVRKSAVDRLDSFVHNW